MQSTIHNIDVRFIIIFPLIIRFLPTFQMINLYLDHPLQFAAESQCYITTFSQFIKMIFQIIFFTITEKQRTIISICNLSQAYCFLTSEVLLSSNQIKIQHTGQSLIWTFSFFLTRCTEESCAIKNVAINKMAIKIVAIRNGWRKGGR